jgi:hypothetical protein
MHVPVHYTELINYVLRSKEAQVRGVCLLRIIIDFFSN